ncbi:LysM peptidoglycan-binding domain-containing protein [Parabacteroides sp. PF5-6]|uniref:PBP1 and LysM peptidoglycan-binding domain-containing protein n=1 Tax=Parabacteroides sp. PF5-6 TaxID=1742403 RepID=UPI0024063330|nr:LysM peptidoglycan-binding domain-containing protein [Parabacteroides sp. PF5-6]MDF9829419.1 LysM repeat protein [Parabacteroides sp. PF5-6]
MIRIFILIFLLGCLPFSPYAQVNNRQTTNTNVQGDDIFYHTIERGQTVYAIATMYGVSVEDIYRLNPGSEKGIRTGDTLRIPQRDIAVTPAETDDNYTYHTIQPKETLYSLSIRYKVKGEDIIRANPGLSVETFQIGKNIRIPAMRIETLPVTEKKTVQKEMEYTVQRRETLYRISRKFDVPSSELIRLNPQLKDGLKAGMVIKIPVETEEIVTEQPKTAGERETNALLDEPKQIKRVDRIQVALLLPFSTGDAKAAARFIEYYEGLLMAVDSLRNTGCSLELSVYDTGDGTSKIQNILKEEALNRANLIIGGVQNDQIKMIADFAQEKNTKYVIPFTSKNDDVLSNAFVYQVNTPHSYLYARAAQAACKLFNQDNIILIATPGLEEKTEYIQTLKAEFEQQQIPYKEITHQTETFITDMEQVLDPEKRNIVIPTSATLEALNRIRPHLRTLSEISTEERPAYSINLFGYPDWQTYTQQTLEDFYALNTYIYSNFYADNLSPDVQYFYTKFKNWYSKNLINSHPKYSILGFDTAMFFFDALRKQGANFENNLNRIHYKSVQTGFHFERVNNWGGFINTHIFIVQYRNDFTVSRNEI